MTRGDIISCGNNITCEPFHLFEKIIRVCRYDGFSSGQWKNKMDRVIIF